MVVEYANHCGSRKWMKSPEGRLLMVFCVHANQKREPESFISDETIKKLIASPDHNLEKIDLENVIGCLIKKNYLIKETGGVRINKMPKKWKGITKVTFKEVMAVDPKENKKENKVILLKPRDWNLIERAIKPNLKDTKVCLYKVLKPYFANTKKRRRKIRFFVNKNIFKKISHQGASPTDFFYQFNPEIEIKCICKEPSRIMRFGHRTKRRPNQPTSVPITKEGLEDKTEFNCLALKEKNRVKKAEMIKNLKHQISIKQMKIKLLQKKEKMEKEEVERSFRQKIGKMEKDISDLFRVIEIIKKG